MKIKTFSANSLEELEKAVNKWLDKINRDSIGSYAIRIRYQVYVPIVTLYYGNGGNNDTSTEYTYLIHYTTL